MLKRYQLFFSQTFNPFATRWMNWRLMLDVSVTLETCLLAFTETWLGDADPNEDLHITGFGFPVRMDRSPLITNKSRGGGVCFYINERYTTVILSWSGKKYVPQTLSCYPSQFAPSTCRGSFPSFSSPLFTFIRGRTSHQPFS